MWVWSLLYPQSLNELLLSQILSLERTQTGLLLSCYVFCGNRVSQLWHCSMGLGKNTQKQVFGISTGGFGWRTAALSTAGRGVHVLVQFLTFSHTSSSLPSGWTDCQQKLQSGKIVIQWKPEVWEGGGSVLNAWAPVFSEQFSFCSTKVK